MINKAEGQGQISISPLNDVIVFGSYVGDQPVDAFRLDPETARSLAQLLVRAASVVEKKQRDRSLGLEQMEFTV